ncbi:DMT family transporter [Haloplasma contractile]|uniref:Transporter Drug-Metabolite Exporter family protein n=1 Tax=Haloplasma contractile SSD-17B TaxID=1033810 RepID=U2EEG3_9MOLU|nr:DMT family transporter [Haloplasma contractile]ERJ13086.1 Transporter Drug-Metabolite Exporter family protein [Haloplasma contractile SSD-17B]
MKNILLLILGVFLVSFTGTLVKLSEVDISVIAMYRLAIGGSILFVFALRDPKLYTLKLKEFNVLLIGGLIISMHYLAYFKALTLTTVTSTTLIICTQPLVALIFGYFLYREKISRAQFIALLLSFVGVGIVARGDINLGPDAILGDFLTFVAVILYVIYLLIGKQIVTKYSFIIYTSILFLIASFILFIYNLIYGYDMANFTTYNWVLLLLMAMIPNAGQVIFIYVLKYLKSSLVATAILLEPFIATVIAMIFLRESVLFAQIVGGLLIIVSVFFYIKLERMKELREQYLKSIE